MTRYDRRRPITLTDLRHALEAHVQALAACGITYDGRIGLDEGSKMYGRAFRLYRTGFPTPCQHCRGQGQEPGTGAGGHGPYKDCTSCGGTGTKITSAHYPPPIGDDYLGMTKAEAYETLTARTRTIYDTTNATTERTSK